MVDQDHADKHNTTNTYRIVRTTETGETVAAMDNEIVYYTDPEDAVKAMSEIIPEMQQLDTPIRLLAESPRLLNGETIILPGGYVVAIDCPGYTFMMNTFPEEAADLYMNVRNRMAILASGDPEKSITLENEDGSSETIVGSKAYRNIVQLTNAGDETLSLFPQEKSSPLEVIAFCLEYQVQFTRELQRPMYNHIRKYLQEHKDAHTPTISAGVAYGELTARIVNLRDPNNINEASGSRLLVMGPELMVKAMGGAKSHFIAHDIDLVETSEMLRAGAALQPPTVHMSNVPSQYQFYLDKINKAGIKIVEPGDRQEQELDFYLIKIPNGASSGEILLELEKAVQVLKYEAEQLHKDIKENRVKKDHFMQASENPIVRSLDLQKALEISDRLSLPPRIEEETSSSIGEVAFYDIQGLSQLRDQLTKKLDDKDAAAIIVTEATAFVAEAISRETTPEHWIVENIEADNIDALRLLVEHDILSPDPRSLGKFVDSPATFEALIKSIQLIHTPEFKRNLLWHLGEKFPDHLTRGGFLEMYDHLNFRATIGLVACEVPDDNFAWVRKEFKDQKNYAWWRVVGGSAPSAAARLNGLGSHGRIGTRIRLLEKKTDKTAEEKESLRNMKLNEQRLNRIASGSCIVMQKAVAEAFGLLDEDNPDVVVIDKVHLKGLPLTDIVVWGIPTT